MPESNIGEVPRAAVEAPTVLFVCTGNAGRSQMAEAVFRRHLAARPAGGAGGGDDASIRARIASAGVDPWPNLHPMARHLLSERGIDLGGHYPKTVARALHLLAGPDTGTSGSPPSAGGAAAAALPEEVFVDVVVTLGDPARDLLPRAAFGAAYWLHWDIGDPADADGTVTSESVFRATLAAIERLLPDLEALLVRAPALHHWARCPGISTGLWDPLDPARHLPLIAAAGFRAIELNLYRGVRHFDASHPADVRQLRRVADDLGLLVWSIHSPDVGSLAAAHAPERRRQLDALRHCLDLADTLGARVIPSHGLLLGPFDEDPEGCEERLAEALTALAAAAEPSGAQIAFENAGFTAPQAATTAAVLQRLDRASRAAFGFVLDTGHAHLDGDLDALAAGLGDHLVSLHLNDNDGRGDLHLPPGEGSADWPALTHLIAEAGYRGVLMYEVAAASDPEGRLRSTMESHRHLVAPSLG